MDAREQIDITFDFRSDTPAGRLPWPFLRERSWSRGS